MTISTCVCLQPNALCSYKTMTNNPNSIFPFLFLLIHFMNMLSLLMCGTDIGLFFWRLQRSLILLQTVPISHFLLIYLLPCRFYFLHLQMSAVIMIKFCKNDETKVEPRHSPTKPSQPHKVLVCPTPSLALVGFKVQTGEFHPVSSSTDSYLHFYIYSTCAFQMVRATKLLLTHSHREKYICQKWHMSLPTCSHHLIWLVH